MLPINASNIVIELFNARYVKICNSHSTHATVNGFIHEVIISLMWYRP